MGGQHGVGTLHELVQCDVELVDAGLELCRYLGLLLDELLKQFLVPPDDGRQLLQLLVQDVIPHRRAELRVLLEDGQDVFECGDGGHKPMPIDAGPSHSRNGRLSYYKAFVGRQFGRSAAR